MSNLNCIDSVRASLETTRKEIIMVENNAWPASWNPGFERHRDAYLATIKSQEQRLSCRLEYLKGGE